MAESETSQSKIPKSPRQQKSISITKTMQDRQVRIINRLTKAEVQKGQTEAKIKSKAEAKHTRNTRKDGSRAMATRAQ